MEDAMVTAGTLARARAGDEQAFRELTDPYRGELLAHCYQILGSVADAEDMLQETLLAAWRGLTGFEGRSSVRAWLHRIAVNGCLNALRDRRRRPGAGGPRPGPRPPAPPRGGPGGAGPPPPPKRATPPRGPPCPPAPPAPPGRPSRTSTRARRPSPPSCATAPPCAAPRCGWCPPGPPPSPPSAATSPAPRHRSPGPTG